MEFKNIQSSICILIFFIVLFFIYHIYYKYKPIYEGFSSGGFKEGFESNVMNKNKTNLSIEEIAKRAANDLPYYKYKEDIPTDEITKNPNVLMPNNSEEVNFNKVNESSIEKVEKKMNSGDFVFNDGRDIWSKFYCSIYDSLMMDKTKNRYELKEIINTTKPNKNSKFLDIGSGTGHHVNMLKKNGFQAVGIDSSYEMVQKAKENYPDLKFYNTDVLNGSQFQNSIFTHATMLYMTLYYIQNKREAFYNIYNWLKPNGYMIIHLVNREKFDPRIEASDPLYNVNPQKYAKERITKSYVKFNDFQYKGEFILDGKNSRYMETMKSDVGSNAIKNQHNYYMETQKSIVVQAESVGFKLKGRVDMSICYYPFEFLYVFQKA
jgi:SAM-dependent methyltransferase